MKNFKWTEETLEEFLLCKRKLESDSEPRAIAPSKPNIKHRRKKKSLKWAKKTCEEFRLGKNNK